MVVLWVVLPFVAIAQGVTVQSSSWGAAEVSLAFAKPVVATSASGDLLFNTLAVEGCVTAGQEGTPSLPVFTRMLEVPICGSLSVEVIDAQYHTYAASDLGVRHLLMPKQPHRSKADTSEAVFCFDKQAYATDTMWGKQAPTVRVVGISRYQRLAKLSVCPVRYNPVSQMVEVCSSMTLRIVYHDVDTIATQQLRRNYISAHFVPESNLLTMLPYDGHAAKSAESRAPDKMLIVADSTFRGQLDDFIHWKWQQGILAEVVYNNDPEVGRSSSSIAAYIRHQYAVATPQTPAPTYLLIVGDVAQIPSFASRATNGLDRSHPTDLYYATWTDGDYLPDCYYGRISAATAAELQTQLRKIMQYEQYRLADPSYLGTAVLVSGKDAGYPADYAYNFSDPAMDYLAIRYFTPACGYPTRYYFKNDMARIPHGVAVSGDSKQSASASQLLRIYNSGAGWINYSGHGLVDYWQWPSFTAAQASVLDNAGKPSVVVGSCCYSGNYGKHCLGEILMRRGDMAGAVAYIGSSNATYWQDDFYWSVGFRSLSDIRPTMHLVTDSYDADHLGAYDALFHIANEPFAAWRTPLGAMVNAGNMQAELDPDEGYAHYYWEVYNLLGDPSMQPWLGIALPPTLSVAAPVSRSSGQVVVTTEPYAYVALLDAVSQTIVCAATANAEGDAVLLFDPASVDNSLVVTTSAQGFIPMSQQIRFADDSVSRLVVSHFVADGAVAGDTVSFSFSITNGTTDTLHNVNYLLRGDPTLIMPLQQAYYIQTICPGQTVVCHNVCRSILSPAIADLDRVNVTMQFLTEQYSFDCATSFIVKAPKLKVSRFQTEGSLLPGSTNTLAVRVINSGHGMARHVVCGLSQMYQLVSIVTDSVVIDSLQMGDTVVLKFNFVIPEDASLPAAIPLTLAYGFRNYCVTNDIEIPLFSEDFETADWSRLPWQHDTPQTPWELISSKSEWGTYSAASCKDMDHRGASRLSLTINLTKPDSVSFSYLVSSESSYDFLSFLIDGVEVWSVSGTDVTTWRRIAFEIASGMHTITFAYTKDYAGSVGDDRAYIDAIQLPATNTIEYRYLSDTVCSGDSYLFMGDTLCNSCAADTLVRYAVEDTLVLFRLSVLPPPTVHIHSSDTEALRKQTIFLVADGAQSYQWSTGDSVASIRIVLMSDTLIGVAGLRAGCVGYDSVFIRIRPLGVENCAEGSALSVFPNPARSQVEVAAPGLQWVELYGATGQLVLSQKANGSSARLSVTTLPAGIYMLKLVSQGRVYVRRLVVE
ncbi:MAG: T9SS type A sorting domain-containing protein [Bacteroidales bacterium]|nr:T9SS type A sorting domain-containing protein [Candidatus Colimorpha onthohippi]